MAVFAHAFVARAVNPHNTPVQIFPRLWHVPGIPLSLIQPLDFRVRPGQRVRIELSVLGPLPPQAEISLLADKFKYTYRLTGPPPPAIWSTEVDVLPSNGGKWRIHVSLGSSNAQKFNFAEFDCI
jgi:hypothetical protein